MRYVVIGAGWLWGLGALPEVTNAGFEFIWWMWLFLSGALIGLVWVLYSAVVPGVFHMSRVRWLWLSGPVIGLGGCCSLQRIVTSLFAFGSAILSCASTANRFAGTRTHRDGPTNASGCSW